MSNTLKEKIAIAQWLLNPDSPCREINDWPELEKKLQKNNLQKVFYEIELPLIPVLRQMEQLGIGVKRGDLERKKQTLNKELAALTDEIYRLAGGEFNINSSQQLAKIIFGRPQSTSAEKLEAVKDQQPMVKPVLRYRELYKLKSTYIEPFLKMSAADGRIHTRFIQTGTATGRLSSRKPNLQNLPPEIKALFVPAAGYKLVSFDYSQIELRILAAVSGDRNLQDAFRQGVDIHRWTAGHIFNQPVAKVTEKMRQLAKTLNFGVVYGMGSRAFSRAAGIPEEQAGQFIDEFFSDFSGVRRWQLQIIAQARKQGFVENLNGRKRWLTPGTTPGAVINMPIQSLAADIIKLAMIKINKNLSLRLLLSVHDELLFEIDIDNDRVKEASAAVKEIMESAYPLAVPLAVNVKLSSSI